MNWNTIKAGATRHLPDRQRLAKSLEFAHAFAALAIRLREKPRLTDYLALGVSFADTGVKIYDEFSIRTSYHAGEIFNVGWNNVPIAFIKPLESLIQNLKPVARARADFHAESQVALIGDLNGCPVGLLRIGDKTQRMLVPHKDEDRFYLQATDLLWRALPGTQVVMQRDGIADDSALFSGAVETEISRSLEHRVSSFIEAGLARNYLLLGHPGAGKTTAVQLAARKLGLKSLRLPIAILGAESLFEDGFDFGGRSPTPETLVRSLRPDVVIVDDVDRLKPQKQAVMLDFFEQARKFSRCVFATVNDIDDLIGPLKRPGRFDDVIHLGAVDEGAKRKLLGEELFSRYAPRMGGWPIAFVCDFLSRVKALGEEQAEREIPAIQQSIELSQRPDRKSDARARARDRDALVGDDPDELGELSEEDLLEEMIPLDEDDL